MGHDQRSATSAAGTAAAVTVVLILLTVGGVVMVGGVWFFRESRMRQEAMILRDRAMREQALARAAMDNAEAMAEAVETTALSTSSIPRLVTIKIDATGGMRIDGERLALADLKASLEQVKSQERSGRYEVEIQVDERCLASHILAVIEICNEVGVPNTRLASLAGGD